LKVAKISQTENLGYQQVSYSQLRLSQ